MDRRWRENGWAKEEEYKLGDNERGPCRLSNKQPTGAKFYLSKSFCFFCAHHILLKNIRSIDGPNSLSHRSTHPFVHETMWSTFVIAISLVSLTLNLKTDFFTHVPFHWLHLYSTRPFTIGQSFIIENSNLTYRKVLLNLEGIVLSYMGSRIYTIEFCV